MTEQELQEAIDNLSGTLSWTGRGSMISSTYMLALILQQRTGEYEDDVKLMMAKFSKEFGVKMGLVRRSTQSYVRTDAIVNFDSDAQRMAFFLITGIKKPDDYRTRKRNNK